MIYSKSTLFLLLCIQITAQASQSQTTHEQVLAMATDMRPMLQAQEIITAQSAHIKALRLQNLKQKLKTECLRIGAHKKRIQRLKEGRDSSALDISYNSLANAFLDNIQRHEQEKLALEKKAKADVRDAITKLCLFLHTDEKTIENEMNTINLMRRALGKKPNATRETVMFRRAYTIYKTRNYIFEYSQLTDWIERDTKVQNAASTASTT